MQGAAGFAIDVSALMGGNRQLKDRHQWRFFYSGLIA